MHEPVLISVHDESDVGRVVFKTQRFAREIGFNKVDEARLATIASELATNIVRYADRGQIALRWLVSPLEGLAIESTDHGPGIENVELALEDHQTTTRNSLGLGLPGVKRMADAFEIESIPGRGLRVLATRWLP